MTDDAADIYTTDPVIKNMHCFMFCKRDTDPNNNDIIYSLLLYMSASSVMPLPLLLFFIKRVQPFSVKMRNWCAPLFEIDV